MKTPFPLYAKILLWFLLNLGLLGAGLVLLFRAGAEFSFSFAWMLSEGRIQAVSHSIVADLNHQPVAEWDGVLARYGDTHKIRFLVFHNDGTQVAGDRMQPPGELIERLRERTAHGPPPRPPTLFESGMPFPKSMLRTTGPVRYWVVVRAPISAPEPPPPKPMSLVMMSDSLTGHGVFVDSQRWLTVAAGVVLLSALLWFPFVRGITHSIRHMTGITERIAEGRFDSRVDERRADELGRLGQAINRMTARLEGFVTGQRRFLGDIAHELRSPLTRIQLSIDILEQSADEKQKVRIAALGEEVRQMTELVNELLSYSEAGLAQKQIRLESVALRELVERVVARESPGGSIEIEIGDAIHVLAAPDLLERALGNVVRNALRYASGPGKIVIAARAKPQQVSMTVADSGPGLPDQVLDRVMDPFFRPETSRSRELGGAGLGLAIVKTCIDACQGSVSIRNRQPSGLEVEFRLRPGASQESGKTLA